MTQNTFKPVLRSEHAGDMNGVSGRFRAVTVRPDESPFTFCKQDWVSESRSVQGYGEPAKMHVTVCFDDELRNGHNTFSITADVRATRRSRDNTLACGCMHDEIREVFPELAPLIKWHLSSTEGPMHYIANTVYLAGDRDCYGLRKGERRALEWYPVKRIGEGKERELDTARSVAVWPDATDEELSQDPQALREALEARLPALLAAFKADITNAGFLWDRSEVTQ